MKFTPPFRRVNTAKGHKYVDAEGRRVPGVTTIVDGGTPKDALVNWSAAATADAAINRWDELAGKPPAERHKTLLRARFEDKDKAANRGTEVHHYAERFANGETDIDVPEEIASHVESCVRFLDEFQVEPQHVEFGVVSYTYGYAGTSDLIAVLTMRDGTKQRLWLDWKTSRSGIFGSTVLQLAGYGFADHMVIDGQEHPIPDVDGFAAVWLRADGYVLHPLTVNEDVFRTFLYAQQIYEWSQVDRDFIGSPMRPPSTSVYRLVRGEQS